MDRQANSEVQDRLIRQSLTVSEFLCLLGLAFPLLAAAGWIFNIELLKAVYPTFPEMQPNTVLGLVLASIAILFSGDNRRAQKNGLVPCTIGAIISLFGLLTLSEYIWGWDLGIDRIFFFGRAAV